MLRWLKTLPAKVADHLAVTAIVAALAVAAGWLVAGGARAAATEEVTVDAWVLVSAVAGLGALWTVAAWVLARRREGRLAATADAHASYGEHIRNVLDQLQNVLSGSIAGVSIDDFVERGVLAPGRDMLLHGQAPGHDVRLSILVPEAHEFVMRYSAGHTPAGHGQFRMPIGDSFSRHAFEQARPVDSPDLEHDARFRAHPAAERPYRSIVSVPLVVGGRVVGVLNAVFTADHGYDEADYTYVALLAAIVNVALAANTSGGDPAEG